MVSNPSTSADLLIAVRDAGNDEAWRRFVAIYGPVVYRLARKKGLSRDDSEQVTQNAFIRMVKVLHRFEYDPKKGRFRNWVFTLALNEIRRYLRAGAAEDRIIREYKENPPNSVVEGNDLELEWWRCAEATRLLHLALEELKRDVTEEHFDIFCALVFRRESGEAVAIRTRRNRNQVYGIKFRLLARLRLIAEQIGDAYDEH